MTVGLGLFVGGVVVGAAPPATAFLRAACLRSMMPEPVAPVAAAVSEPANASTSVAAADLASPRVAQVAPPTSATRHSPDRLAQEVALLSRATSALRSGRPADALTALNEHQSQFPKGVLAEERRAARAQALCLGSAQRSRGGVVEARPNRTAIAASCASAGGLSRAKCDVS